MYPAAGIASSKSSWLGDGLKGWPARALIATILYRSNHVNNSLSRKSVEATGWQRLDRKLACCCVRFATCCSFSPVGFFFFLPSPSPSHVICFYFWFVDDISCDAPFIHISDDDGGM